MYADTAITEIMVVETTGLSGGAIAGIVIGVVAVVTLAIIAFTKIKINLSDAFMLVGMALMAINMNRTVFYFIFVVILLPI